jgi:flavocytochrome c
MGQEGDGLGASPADVVVVGSGYAGLAAAVEARQAGATVLVLEKMAAPGGNSVISDGSMAAAGSDLQRALGIEDSPELMYRDMLRAGLGLNHPALARLVAESSAGAHRWTVEALGVRYQPQVLQFGGHSVPRTHATPGLSGAALYRPLRERALALGVELALRSTVTGLVRNARGAVTGVRVRQGTADGQGPTVTVRATRGVIVTTGGFAADVGFRMAQDPRLGPDVASTNSAGATAEVLKQMLRAGAAPVHLSWIQLGPWASPDEEGNGVGPTFATYVAFPYGIVVDPATGRRFVNEMADRRTRADALLAVGHPCLAIADAAGVERSRQSIAKCLRRKVVRTFDSLGALGGAFDVPIAELERTVAAYSEAVARGADERLGKPILVGAAPIASPPFYAMRLWPKAHYTMGGVRIDTSARVLDLDGRPIPGLYAAGEVTGGVHGACRLGSVSITECLVMGGVAGRKVVETKTRRHLTAGFAKT